MKHFTTSLLLITLFITALCSCKTYWDVEPKEVYSPIDLSKGISISSVKKMGSIDSVTIKFSISDSIYKNNVLKFGVIVFYDSLFPKLLVNNNIVVKDSDKFISNSPKQGNVQSVRVAFNPIGQPFAYILPFATDKTESIRLYSKNYIKLPISPWLPVLSFSSDIFALPENGKILILNDLGDNKLNSFEFDTDINSLKKTEKGSILLNLFEDSTSLFVGHDLNGNRDAGNWHISDIKYTFFDGKSNHFIISAVTEYGIQPFAVGDLLLTEDFKINDFIIYKKGENDFDFVFSNYNNNKLESVFYDDKSCIVSTINISNNKVEREYNLGKIISSIGSPIIQTAIKVENFVLLKLYGEPFLRKYNLNIQKNGPTFENIQLPFLINDLTDKFISLMFNNSGYLINRNFNIYKFENVLNNIKATELLIDWIPGRSRYSISQGFLVNGKFYFVVDDTQLWSFDPAKMEPNYADYKIVNY